MWFLPSLVDTSTGGHLKARGRLSDGRAAWLWHRDEPEINLVGSLEGTGAIDETPLLRRHRRKRNIA